MIFQYASDLHLEFPKNKKAFERRSLAPIGEILLLAGDILPFTEIEKHNDFFNYISDHFKTTYWIPGNHEYYGYDAANKHGQINEAIRSNVYLINNDKVTIEDKQLIFSTMWTHIGPVNALAIQSRMNDFFKIKFNGLPFNHLDYNFLHAEAMAFLKPAIEEKNDYKKIVVTHHVPTLLNYPNKYKNNILQEGFAVELFDLIETSEVCQWIYGHHHFNTLPFQIGSTQLVTNQLGYVQYNEHKWFKKQAIFEL
jgi:predicted phosphohydrolase